MRNMSFALTTQQIRDRTKTVTRRKGWQFLKAGDRIRAVVKSRGQKPGEDIERLAALRIVSVRREPLNAVTDDDVAREGFPGMTGLQFADKFCRDLGGDVYQTVTRIEFEYTEAREP